MTTVYLGLGSNLGDRAANLSETLRRLAGKLSVQEISSLYETEPWGMLDQPKFLNAVCSAETNLSPHELLQFTQSTEQGMGRVHTERWGPRNIDIDILFYNNIVLDTLALTLPHPRITERAFVLVPLAEIAPDVIHPRVGLSVRVLLQRRDDAKTVQFIGKLTVHSSDSRSNQE